MASDYETRPVKRNRRTKAQMNELRDTIISVLERDNPMTVRGIFYQLVVLEAIAKTENEYKAISRIVTSMRRDRTVPFSWITDSSRMMLKARSYSSYEAALYYVAQTYRRALWHDLPVYVEIWCESNAIAGVLYEETNIWDIPLMACGGYSSVTFLHSAAESIQATQKPTFLYYFGDYDPTGQDITRQVEDGIREFAPEADVHFEPIAVTPAQIEEWQLPGRPPKSTDSRIKNFHGESVELDAIPASTLRRLVRECVARHVDQDIVERWIRVEELERHTLAQIAGLDTDLLLDK